MIKGNTFRLHRTIIISLAEVFQVNQETEASECKIRVIAIRDNQGTN